MNPLSSIDDISEDGRAAISRLEEIKGQLHSGSYFEPVGEREKERQRPHTERGKVRAFTAAIV